MEHGGKKHHNLTYKVLPKIEGWQGDKTEITGVCTQWDIGQRLHTNKYNFTITMGSVCSLLKWNSCVAVAQTQLIQHRSFSLVTDGPFYNRECTCHFQKWQTLL